MRDIENTKPQPARPRDAQSPSASVKPTPARELGGTEAREAPEPVPRTAPGTEPDIAEATLEADGVTWTVRVLGRSGRAAERAPPLLLLGFWRQGEAGEHEREATVVARTLAELLPGRLEDALAGSTPPPRDVGRKPFFDQASQGRRGGDS